MRTWVWILGAVVFLVPFAVPGFVPSEDARQRALAYGFTQEQIDVGQQYGLERRVLFWAATLNEVVLLAWLAWNGRRLADGAGRLVRGRWIPTLLLVGLVLLVAGEVVNFAFGLVRLEHARIWGMTSQGRLDWMQQHFLAVALYACIQALILVAFYLLIRYFPRTWWLWSALGTTLVGILFAFLLPIFFAPLFNTFRPLSQTEWKDLEPRVQRLLAQAGVEVHDVLVMDASRQSGHTNAYFSGFGPTRQIVLYDTLLKKHSPEEIESILAHELGHWLHDHIVQATCLGALAALVGFYLLYRFLGWVRGGGPWYLRDAADPAGLPLIIYVSVLALWVVQPIGNAVSRHFERQADAMSLQLAGDPDVFIAAERKLTLDNLSNPAPNPISVLLFSTHPTAVDRMRMALDWKGRQH